MRSGIPKALFERLDAAAPPDACDIATPFDKLDFTALFERLDAAAPPDACDIATPFDKLDFTALFERLDAAAPSDIVTEPGSFATQ